MVTDRTLKLTHLSLGVGNLDESEHFYRDVLELPVERFGESQLRIEWPDFLLVLELAPPPQRSKFHFGFEVDSAAEVDRWAERVQTMAGGNVLSGPSDRDSGRVAFISDPDHYTIEIYNFG